jgi:hypothetical protein
MFGLIILCLLRLTFDFEQLFDASNVPLFTYLYRQPSAIVKLFSLNQQPTHRRIQLIHDGQGLFCLFLAEDNSDRKRTCLRGQITECLAASAISNSPSMLTIVDQFRSEVIKCLKVLSLFEPVRCITDGLKDFLICWLMLLADDAFKSNFVASYVLRA